MYMYVYMHGYMHVYMHGYMHVYMHGYVHRYMHVYMHGYVHMYRVIDVKCMHIFVYFHVVYICKDMHAYTKKICTAYS